nr:MAG: hypothetical protein DiTV3a_F3ORF9 [Diabrotica toursvirus 3a]
MVVVNYIIILVFAFLLFFLIKKSKKNYCVDEILGDYKREDVNVDWTLYQKKHHTVLEISQMVQTKTKVDYSLQIKNLFGGYIPRINLDINNLITNFKNKSKEYDELKKYQMKIIKYYAVIQWINAGNSETFPILLEILSDINYEWPETAKKIIDREIYNMNF